MRFGENLHNFKGLTSIILSTLHDCSGATARRLKSLPHLEALTIYNCNGVRNENLRHLAPMTNLKLLNLGKNEVRLDISPPRLCISRFCAIIYSKDQKSCWCWRAPKKLNSAPQGTQ